MARDYKPKKKKRKAKKKSGAPTGAGYLIFGLIIGIVIGWGMYKLQPQQLITSQDNPVAPMQELKKEPQNKIEQEENQSKPRFDFYTLLPEMEVVVPEYSDQEFVKREIEKVKKQGTYLLQVGSFRKHVDADSLKANLALLGIKAKIQTISIDDKDTWHRVRIGPYSNLELLNRIRSQLSQNEIDFIILKVSSCSFC